MDMAYMVLLLFFSFIVSALSEGNEKDEPYKCYGDFGCFSLATPWNSVTRPINLFPDEPKIIDPKYCLYTTRNPKLCDRLEIGNPKSLYDSNYVTKGQVYFIAHGFLEDGNKTWIQDLTHELLKRSSCNVIVIDWSGGSGPPYTQAVANIRLVGVMTAHLINMMANQTVGLDVSHTHVIGHSLGAHLASYIGTTLRREFKMKLGRISGLDPAEPHFSKTETIVRLDPSDAIFVDNIHTDAVPFISGGLGMTDPIGHVDFYPNGGRDQPGCDVSLMRYMNSEDGSLFKGVRRMLGCNHIRSYQYFIESINTPEKFMAIQCDDWLPYLQGDCFKCNNEEENGTSRCARFGFHSIQSFGNRNTFKTKYKMDTMLSESPKQRFIKMYLITADAPMFARSQYRISLKISEASHEYGLFKVKIIGDKNSTQLMALSSKDMYFDAGSLHTRVVAGHSVGNIQEVHLIWTYKSSFFNPLSWRVAKSSIQINYLTVDSLDTQERFHFCPQENQKLFSNSPMKFNSTNICPRR